MRDTRQIGLQSNSRFRINENAIDGRTRLAKQIEVLRKGLEEYVGETTIATDILINRIIYKHLRLSAYENKKIEDPEHIEAQHYLPMANSLRLDLQALQGIAGQRKPPDLKDYLNAEYGDNDDDIASN